MKSKKILSKILACAMSVTLVLSIPSAVNAEDNKDQFSSNVLTMANISDSLQNMGLYLDVPSLPEHNMRSLNTKSAIPHISRISQNKPINISTEADVDLLLMIANVVFEQQLAGFSWDACVDIALVEAGLYDYWRNGFRQVAQEFRDHALIDLAMNYTVEELHIMGVFERYGIIDEFQSLGFFLYEFEMVGSFALNSQPLPPPRSIPHMSLRYDRWMSNFRVFFGDSVSYTIHYQIENAPPVLPIRTILGTGIGDFNQSQGVGHGHVYYVPINLRTDSRTIHVGFLRGPSAFGLQPGGANSFTVSGTYRVTW